MCVLHSAWTGEDGQTDREGAGGNRASGLGDSKKMPNTSVIYILEEDKEWATHRKPTWEKPLSTSRRIEGTEPEASGGLTWAWAIRPNPGQLAPESRCGDAARVEPQARFEAARGRGAGTGSKQCQWWSWRKCSVQVTIPPVAMVVQSAYVLKAGEPYTKNHAKHKHYDHADSPVTAANTEEGGGFTDVHSVNTPWRLQNLNLITCKLNLNKVDLK